MAIVGDGFSGTMVASQLLRIAKRPPSVVLIDRSGDFGRGLAYGTHDPGHLLNVSAGTLSAWPEDPSHWLRWNDLNCSAFADHVPETIDAGSFLPRHVYGLYLQSSLQEAVMQVSAQQT